MTPPSRRTILLHARSLAVAALGGAVAAFLHTPLPWMIGAMLATAALAWRGEVAHPRPTRPASLILLGLGLGQTFTGPVLAAVVLALPAMVAGGVLTILSGVAVAWIFRRLADTDARTGYFCAVPGGVIVMAVLAQRAGGVEVAAVTLSQTLRMCLVVLVFPPLIAAVAPGVADAVFSAPRPEVVPLGLAGLLAVSAAVAWAFARAGLANPWMLAPCGLAILLSALGQLPSGIPLWLVDVAQVGMGATLGARLTRRFLLSSRRLAVAAILSCLALFVLLTALAPPVAWAWGLPAAGVVLGMAPGGMPEMAITAKALDLAVPLVLGFHLVRVLLCNLLVGPIWRLASGTGLIR